MKTNRNAQPTAQPTAQPYADAAALAAKCAGNNARAAAREAAAVITRPTDATIADAIRKTRLALEFSAELAYMLNDAVIELENANESLCAGAWLGAKNPYDSAINAAAYAARIAEIAGSIRALAVSAAAIADNAVYGE